jgi:hypothetical protein
MLNLSLSAHDPAIFWGADMAVSQACSTSKSNLNVKAIWIKTA